ncbi:MAG: acyl-CoA dehydrogenase [Mycobacterium sp.]|uniref:acyl-CoA dehydrogenase family protein n=1 Tax=Mycobacterium sp. TaxID=1785 RepID=UPI003CC57FA9
MSVGPGPEQLALRDSVRAVLRAESPPDVARQVMTDPKRWRNLWEIAVELGWTEVAAFAAGGGTAYGATDLVLLLEESGAAIAPIPLLSSVGLAAGVLRAAGPVTDKFRDAIAGGVVATAAVHPLGRRLPGVTMTLQQGRLRGSAVAVPDLSRAELIVALAASDDGVVAVIAHNGADITSAPAAESTNPAQPLADIEVDTVPEAVAPVDLDAALATPLLAAAADLVGVAGAVLARSVEHAKSRRQFGKPIGAFQGVKHALADNYVLLERARSLTYAAAARLDDPTTAPAAAWTAAAQAKATAGEAAVSSARTAVQVHGAIAQTWEHDIHLYLRCAWQGAATLGDSRALYYDLGRRFTRGAA